MTICCSRGLTIAALATLGLLAVAHPAHASTNIVQDGGFETPVTLTTGNYVYDPTGSPWAFTGNSGVVKPPSDFESGNSTGPTGYGGSQYAFIQSNATGGTGAAGVFTQTFNLSAATTYNLSFLYAGRNGVPSNDGKANDFVTLDGAIGQGNLFSENFSTTDNQAFTSSGGSFTTVSGGSYTLTFSNTSTSSTGGDHTSFIDNVDVSAAPEPSQVAGLALTGFGALGLILTARKRKANEMVA